jgi:hypothetical protein
MTGVREAAFAQHVDRVGGRDGVDALATEGHAAHQVSSELQELARTNTPESVRRARHADRRHRREVLLLVLLLGLGLVWVGGNLVGYLRSDAQERTVSGRGFGVQHVQLTDGSTARVDCWSSGPVEQVWKSAAPVGWVMPYRCGEGALAAGMPGLMSAVAAFVVLLALMLLHVVRKRHRQRLAWY